MTITLWLYIGKRFLATFAAVMFIVAGIILLFDLVELFRIAPRNLNIVNILMLAFLKNYRNLESTIPFLMLLSSMLTYANFTKTLELVMCRSFGLSIWQFLAPSLISSFAIGCLALLLLNPIGTFLYKHHEYLYATKLNKESVISFSKNGGIWLHQEDKSKAETLVMHAENININENSLSNILIFIINKKGDFLRRIDAANATYQDNIWVINNATITYGDMTQKIDKEISIEVTIPWEKFLEKLTDPETLSFLQLMPIIKNQGGLAILKHKMQFYKMLLTPLFFMAMVMVGACFAIRMERFGKTGLLQFAGALTGFIIYFSSNIFYALGAAGTISVYLAACSPIVLCATFSSYYLLHKEDG